MPKLVSVPVSVVSNRNYFRRTPYTARLETSRTDTVKELHLGVAFLEEGLLQGGIK